MVTVPTTEIVLYRVVTVTVPTTEIAFYRTVLTTVPTTEVALYRALMATVSTKMKLCFLCGIILFYVSHILVFLFKGSKSIMF